MGEAGQRPLEVLLQDPPTTPAGIAVATALSIFWLWWWWPLMHACMRICKNKICFLELCWGIWSDVPTPGGRSSCANKPYRSCSPREKFCMQNKDFGNSHKIYHSCRTLARRTGQGCSLRWGTKSLAQACDGSPLSFSSGPWEPLAISPQKLGTRKGCLEVLQKGQGVLCLFIHYRRQT